MVLSSGNIDNSLTPTNNTTVTSRDATMVTPEGDDQNISNPSENDVLCGRGGSINAHAGNERFRDLVEKRKRVYLTARFKREKRLIASSIVSEIRSLNPPGRFLSKNSKTGMWYDIGDEKARDKTSQALRENAPSIRAEIETEINEQRAEIHRVGNEHIPGMLPPPYYAGQGWGYYSYYGYAQHSQSSMHPPIQQVAERPQAPPFPSNHYPPPPPGHGYSSPPWVQSTESPTNCQSSSQRSFFKSDDYPDSEDQKSAFEQTADFVSSVSSVPTTFKKWTEASFSFGAQECNSQDEASEVASVQSKPIVYVHQPEEHSRMISSASTSGRRAVHFLDDPRTHSHPRRRSLPPRAGVMHTSNMQYKPNRYPQKKAHQGYNQSYNHQPHHTHSSNYSYRSDSPDNSEANDGMNSIVDEGMSSIVEEKPTMSYVDDDAPLDDEVECSQDLHQPPDDHTQASGSIISQVANTIFGSLGSWEASAVYEGSVVGSVPSLFGGQSSAGPSASVGSGPQTQRPRRRNSSHRRPSTSSTHDTQSTGALSRDETMAFEIEGQEVQLYDTVEENHCTMEQKAKHMITERRNPPSSAGHNEKQTFEIDWPSRVGSCHSWIPDTLGATSFFSKGSNGSNISPVGSMEMESCGGSVGGGSLCKVFEGENAFSSPRNSITSNSQQRGISQMPSWERSFRSKSPLSIGGSEDDESLISKSSEKIGIVDSAMGDSFREYMAEEMNWDDNSSSRIR